MISFKPFCNECSNDEFYCLRIAGFANTFSFNQVDCRQQAGIAAMREAWSSGFWRKSSKQPANQLQDLPDTWHFIGSLQKQSKTLELFQWIHSLDSLKLAQRLDQLAQPLSCKPQVCHR